MPVRVEFLLFSSFNFLICVMSVIEYNYLFLKYKEFPNKESCITSVTSKFSDIVKLTIPERINDLIVTRIDPDINSKLVSGFIVEVLTLPDTIKDIGAGSFIGISINKIEFPTSLKLLGRYAFCGCNKLKEVSFSKSSELESLESFVFGQCKLLSYIDLPKNLKNIHTSCFYQCYGLRHIVIPPKVNRIDTDAFKGTKLNSVVFEGPVPKYISINSFPGNNKTAYVKKEYLNDYRNTTAIRARFANILPIESLQLEFEIIGSKAIILPKINDNYENDYCGELEIPDFVIFGSRKYKVTRVDQFAFYGSRLTKLIIPKDLNLYNVLLDQDIEIERRD